MQITLNSGAFCSLTHLPQEDAQDGFAMQQGRLFLAHWHRSRTLVHWRTLAERDHEKECECNDVTMQLCVALIMT
eukprot:1909121-Amphidinium_carterae.1